MGCQCCQRHSHKQKRSHDHVRTKPLLVIDSYCVPIKSEVCHQEKEKPNTSHKKKCCCQRRCRRSWI